MKIVPTRMEEQINRVDRTTSLGIGIASGITALCCVYRLIWLLYAAVTFSSVGWSPDIAGLPVRAVGDDRRRGGDRRRWPPDPLRQGT